MTHDRVKFVEWFRGLSTQERVEVWYECECMTAEEVRSGQSWRELSEWPSEPGPLLMCDRVCGDMEVGSYSLYDDGSGEFTFPGRCIDSDKKSRFMWARLPARPA